MQLYSALIVDVVKSRKYKDERLLLQSLLKNSINYLNSVFKKWIIKDVVFSSGDEMQGLFLSDEAAYLYFRKLQIIVSPIKLRCGIGRGKVEFLIDGWNSTEIDGLAYHNAREAINKINHKDEYFMCYKSGLGMDLIINSLLHSQDFLNERKLVTTTLIEEIVEVMHPIVLSEEMALNTNLDDLRKIFREKNKFIELSNLSKREIGESKIDYEKMTVNGYVDVSTLKIDYYNDLFLDVFFKKGLSTPIANILSTSRQNIDKRIISGRIKEIRNLDGSIILILRKLGE